MAIASEIKTHPFRQRSCFACGMKAQMQSQLASKHEAAPADKLLRPMGVRQDRPRSSTQSTAHRLAASLSPWPAASSQSRDPSLLRSPRSSLQGITDQLENVMFRMQDLLNEIQHLDPIILPDTTATTRRATQVPRTQGGSGTSFAHVLRRVDDLAEELHRIRPVLLPLASKCPAWSGSVQAEAAQHDAESLLGKLQQVLSNTEFLLDNAQLPVPEAERNGHQAAQRSLLHQMHEQQLRAEPEEQQAQRELHADSSQQPEQQVSPEIGQLRQGTA
eukprot:TRINITY_DN13803_c0_g1_i1.p1 TRINITY_DN13803_c0_g1~~TRINITY_DN13803_c0_g1_i1.p1  ORF type:complete len:275 (+),score=46.92 TRINITY_DN13803_c0_g1_i1:25-849(+)